MTSSNFTVAFLDPPHPRIWAIQQCSPIFRAEKYSSWLPLFFIDRSPPFQSPERSTPHVSWESWIVTTYGTASPLSRCSLRRFSSLTWMMIKSPSRRPIFTLSQRDFHSVWLCVTVPHCGLCVPLSISNVPCKMDIYCAGQDSHFPKKLWLQSLSTLSFGYKMSPRGAMVWAVIGCVFARQSWICHYPRWCSSSSTFGWDVAVYTNVLASLRW